MKRIGYIYRIPVRENLFYYCQDLGMDRNCLGGNIIRVFNKAFKNKDLPDLNELVNEKVYFETHTFLRSKKFDGWEKIGFIKFDGIVKTEFINNNFDSEIPFNVYIFDMYGKKEYKDWHKIKNREKYEIGDVFPHASIIERIITGDPFEMLWIPE